MESREKLISYAMDFSSYLIGCISEIDRIILHGSVSRGDFTSESDIDLFIQADKKIENKIKKYASQYLETEKFKKWQLKGIENPFSLIVGNLEDGEWKDLKRAVISTGIILYGKYKGDVEKTNQYTIFSLEKITPDKKRIAVYRRLFGFRTKKLEYPGDVAKFGGIKIGKGAIVIPAEKTDKIKKYFAEKKIKVKIYDVWSDSDLT